MPQGDESAYTAKRKRKARHIEESHEQRGLSPKTAARRAWATVNKQDGGGRKGAKRSKKPASSSSKRSRVEPARSPRT